METRSAWAGAPSTRWSCAKVHPRHDHDPILARADALEPGALDQGLAALPAAAADPRALRLSRGADPAIAFQSYHTPAYVRSALEEVIPVAYVEVIVAVEMRSENRMRYDLIEDDRNEFIEHLYRFWDALA